MPDVEQMDVDRVQHLAGGQEFRRGAVQMRINLFGPLGIEQSFDGLLQFVPEPGYIEQSLVVHCLEERIDDQVAESDSKERPDFFDRQVEQCLLLGRSEMFASD